MPKKTETRFSGSASVNGRSITIGDLGIKAIDLRADLSDRKGYPVHVEADIGGLTYGGIRLDRLILKANGTRAHHTFRLEAHTQKSLSLQTTMEGGYAEGSWKGKINTLAGHDAVGPFSLQSPAEIHVSAGEIFVSPLVIRGASGEELRLSAELVQRRPTGYAKASLEHVNLERLNLWLNDMNVSGVVTGNADIRWAQGKLAKVAGKIAASAILSADDHRAVIRDGSLDLQWTEMGLRASLGLHLSEGGMVEAMITSPTSVRPHIPASGELNASWRGLNLLLLRPLLPRGTLASGESSGSLHAEWKQRELVTVKSTFTGSATLVSNDERVEVKNASIRFDWTRIEDRESEEIYLAANRSQGQP